MCKRHSFILAPSGKVLDGKGLIDSHSAIAPLHGLTPSELSECNKYEWQPPKGWPDASYLDGLKHDAGDEVFTPKKSHDAAIKRHLLKRYPTQEAWDAGDKPDADLDGKTVMLDGYEVTVCLTDRDRIDSGRWLIAGDAAVGEVSGGEVRDVYGNAAITTVSGGEVRDVYGKARIVNDTRGEQNHG